MDNVQYFDALHQMKHLSVQEKRVTFGSVHVCQMEDTEEHRQARKSNWMIYATDRIRFKRRIRECEIILGPVLARKRANKPDRG